MFDPSALGALNEHPLSLPSFPRRQMIFGEAPAATRSQPSSPTCFPYARELRMLLEQGRIREAQRLFEFAKDYVQDPKIREALAPPRVKKSSRKDVDRSAEFRWLDLNSARFRGKWVALLGDSLVASADSLRELLASLKALSLKSRPLVHHVD